MSSGVRRSGTGVVTAPGLSRSRGRRVARLLSWGAVVLSVLLLVGTLGSVLVVRHYEGQLTRIALPPSTLVSRAPRTAPAGGLNVLIVGSDTRSGVGGGFGDPRETKGQRSDSVILAHVPNDGSRPTLVSFPRDAYVTVPAYRGADERARAEHRDKLNAAFALGGPLLLVATVERLTGLPVDHYVEVNFAGFERTVDALGGVTLCARTTRNDPANGPMGGSDDFMTRGTHRDVSGAVALAFVRNRHDFPDGDIARIQDQQHFLSQLLDKAVSRGTLTNPARLNAFLTSVTTSLRVDDRLSIGVMRTLALRLRRMDTDHVAFVTLPFRTANGRARINGQRASVVLVDEPAARALFARLRGVPPSPRPAAPARPGGTPAPVAPSPSAPTGGSPSCGA